MKPVLVFDIETIPDVAGLRRLNDLPDGLSDDAKTVFYTLYIHVAIIFFK